MRPPETILATAAGVLVVAFALRDIFDSLFHAEGKRLLSRAVTRGVWWLFHRLAARGRPRFALAGPVALLAVIGAWAGLLITGWALVLWPHIPDAFRVAKGSGGDGFLDAVYLSTVTLTTLGFGDITPTAGWLKLVSPLEALLGFGLLSASISWLLSIYPALLRRRSLAYELWLLRESERERGPLARSLRG